MNKVCTILVWQYELVFNPCLDTLHIELVTTKSDPQWTRHTPLGYSLIAALPLVPSSVADLTYTSNSYFVTYILLQNVYIMLQSVNIL